MPGPVFAMPPPPPDWEAATLPLVRIIDPLGDAIAWFAPEAGGCCAGYAVRRRGDSAPTESPWRWILSGSRSLPAAVIYNPTGEPTEARWQLVSRDPASCTLGRTPPRSPAEHWEMTASLRDAHLSLVVSVRNTGVAPIHAAIHIQLVLASPPEVAGHARPDGSTVGVEHPPITLAMDATPGTPTLRTGSIGDEVVCTVADHPEPGDPPDIPSDGFRQLTVVIGLGWVT